MPGATGDVRTDAIPTRFRPPPSITVFVPVVVAFAVQVPATIAVSLWQRVPAPFAALSIALAAASALALLAARRFPQATVIAVALLTGVDLFVPPDAGPPFLALAFAIVGAVVRGARAWALAAVGTAWVAAIVVGGILGVEWHPLRIAMTTVVLAFCFAVGEGIRRRFENVERRRALLRERRRTAEEDERARIARELHDVLAHSLSQISVQSGVGLHLFDREPERAREALAAIRGLSATGLDEVRGVLGFLRGDEQRDPRTAPLTPQPQLAQLPALVAQRSGLGLTVSLDDRLHDDLPPSAVQTVAFRIAQESLTNVVRHSAATTALVTLRRDDDDLVVSVEDDGAGLGSAPSEGGGIRGMRERALLADGTLDVAAGPRGGTVVTARLPWAGAA
jgi:signal transduction histidine kinase